MESLNQLFTLPAYRMVVINVLLGLVYCLLFIVPPLAGSRCGGTYCFKKRGTTVNYTPWLLLLSILPIISIFRQGTYESGDLSLHATRLMAFWESISQGEIIPRWAGSLNAGYGYPLFQFIYPLPYYFASFWHFIGFGYINSVKITIALAYVLSGWVFYRLAKKHVSGLAAFTGAVLYLFAPYHLVDLHFRVAFGEIIAFVFLPLTMLCGSNYIDSVFHSRSAQCKQRNDMGKETRLWLVLSSLSFAGLLLSHPAISLISPVITIPYWWVMGGKNAWFKRIRIILTPLLLGLILSAFYLIPVFLENKYVWANYFAQGVEFEKFSEYLYSPWRIGLLFQGPYGELSFLIGYTHIFATLFAIYLFLTRRSVNHKMILGVFLGLMAVFVLLLLPYSKLIWDSIPIFRNFRFTYRLLLPIALVTSLMGALIVDQFTKHYKLVYLLIFITVSVTVLNWGNRRTIPQIDDNYLRIDLPYASARGEGLDSGAPKWLKANDLWQKEPAKEIIAKNIDLETYQANYTINRQKVLSIFSSQPTLVVINQLYFPGWTVTNLATGGNIPILYELADHYGMITFHIPAGTNHIEIEFRDTLVRKVAGLISLMSGVVVALFLFRSIKTHRTN